MAERFVRLPRRSLRRNVFLLAIVLAAGAGVYYIFHTTRGGGLPLLVSVYPVEHNPLPRVPKLPFPLETGDQLSVDQFLNPSKSGETIYASPKLRNSHKSIEKLPILGRTNPLEPVDKLSAPEGPKPVEKLPIFGRTNPLEPVDKLSVPEGPKPIEKLPIFGHTNSSKPMDKPSTPEGPNPPKAGGTPTVAKATPTLPNDSLPTSTPLHRATVSTSGRLGNLMFEFAALLGIVAMNNHSHQALLPEKSNLGSFFLLSHPQVASTNHSSYVGIGEKHFASYDPKFETLPQKDVFLKGYFQSWKYFHRIRSSIVKEFTFVKDVQQRALDLFMKAVGSVSNATTIAIHVRRRDKTDPGPVRQGYRPPPASYIRKAADYFRKKYGDVIFVVVSDDAAWCKENLTSPDFVVAGGASAEVHLALLTLCNHVIITSGTFGWWGGYLGGGDVVYYLHNIAPGTFVGKQFKAEDHYLPQWIGIGD